MFVSSQTKNIKNEGFFGATCNCKNKSQTRHAASNSKIYYSEISISLLSEVCLGNALPIIFATILRVSEMYSTKHSQFIHLAKEVAVPAQSTRNKNEARQQSNIDSHYSGI